jgi:hypothetical protein
MKNATPSIKTFIVMLSVIYIVMLSVIQLHVIMPSVVAPKKSKDIIEDYQLNIFIDLVRYGVSFGLKT